MAATLILVNREIVKPGGFLSKIMIYVVKKLATLVFWDIFGAPILVNWYSNRNSQNSYL